MVALSVTEGEDKPLKYPVMASRLAGAYLDGVSVSDAAASGIGAACRLLES